MNAYGFAAVTNVGVCIAVAAALWYTGSLWSFLGLFFLQGVSVSNDKDEVDKDASRS